MALSPVVLALLSLALGIVSLIFGFSEVDANSDNSMAVTYTTFTNTDYDIRNAFSVNPGIFAGSLLIISSGLFFIQLLLRRSNAAFKQWVTDTNSDPMRWLIDSLVTPASVCLSILMWGVSDLGLLLATFGGAHLAILLQWALVSSGKKADGGLSMRGTVLSIWAAAITYLPFLVMAAASPMVGPSTTLYFAAILMAISVVVQAVLVYTYSRAITNPTPDQMISGPMNMWLTNENAITFFCLLPRLVALFLIGMSYTDDNGWISSHSQAVRCIVSMFPLGSATVPNLVQSCPGFTLN